MNYMNDNQLPATRAEAKALGLRHYFTGKPCKNGHVAKRHLTGTCVTCGYAAAKAWETRNPGESSRRSLRSYYRNHARNKALSLKVKRKAMGIPEAERPMTNACELCLREMPPERMHLDHDHVTGKFRGWLCRRCNMALGGLGDTVTGVERALAYLRRVGSS